MSRKREKVHLQNIGKSKDNAHLEKKCRRFLPLGQTGVALPPSSRGTSSPMPILAQDLCLHLRKVAPERRVATAAAVRKNKHGEDDAMRQM